MVIYLEDVKIEAPSRVTSTEGMVNLVSVGDKNIMTRKLTHEFVEEALKSEGYQLLNKYENAHNLLDFVCPSNHRLQVSWNGFQQGRRCRACAGQYVDPELVKSSFQEAGLEPLDVYVNNSTRINFFCTKGKHFHSVSWQAFRQGVRCGVCSGRYVDGEFVKTSFEAEGYELLEPYVNAVKPIRFLCLKGGHEHKLSWNKFSQGRRCGICEATRINDEFVRQCFLDEGYRLIDSYKDSRTPMKFLCHLSHEHKLSWSSFQKGIRCGACYAANLYADSKNQVRGKIVTSINTEIKRQGLNLHWSYFYSKDQIKAIADPIKNIYKNCPEGCSVDHIVPTSRFNLLREEELIACWNPANLRYLDAIANIRRGNRMTPEEIAFMEQNHPEIINAASRRPLIAARVP